MEVKPTYEELEYQVRLLENEARWRKQAEDALKESEERFKILFEYAPDMYILCDTQAVLIDANRAAEKVTGYERHEVVGKNLLSIGIVPEDQLQKAAELLYKISRKIQTGAEEVTILRKDGQRVHVELRAYPVELGARPVVLITARDIGAHKQTIELLSSREERYRKFFETAPDPLLLFDSETANIEEANQAARVLFGHSQAELVGMSLEDLLNGTSDTRIHIPSTKNGKIEGRSEISCIFRKNTNIVLNGNVFFRALLVGGKHLIAGRIVLSAEDNDSGPPQKPASPDPV